MALVSMLLGAAAVFGSPVSARLSHHHGHHHGHHFGHGHGPRHGHGFCPTPDNARDCPEAHCIEFEAESNTSNDKTGRIVAKNKCLGDVKVKFEREMPFKWWTQTKCKNAGTFSDNKAFRVAIPDLYNKHECKVDVSAFAIDNKFSGSADKIVSPWQCSVPACKTCDYNVEVDLPLAWCRKARKVILKNLIWAKKHDRTIKKIINKRKASFESKLKEAVVTRCMNTVDDIDTIVGAGATMPRLPWLGVCEMTGEVTIAQQPMIVDENTKKMALRKFAIKTPAFPGAKTLKEQVEEKLGGGYQVTKFGLIEIDRCDRIASDSGITTAASPIPAKGSGIIAVVCGEAPAI